MHLMYRADRVLRGFDEECRGQVTENLAKRDIKVKGGQRGASRW